MKRLQLCVATLALTGAAMAQRPYSDANINGRLPFVLDAARTPTDTIIPAGLLDPEAELAVYTSSVGSYVFGTNTFGDKAKVQVFDNTGTVMIERLLILFAAKDVAGAPNANVHARIYALDGAGTNAADVEVNTAPGTVLGNSDLTIGACDTTGFLTTFYFNPAVSVTNDFGGGFDVSDLGATQALGAFSTTEDGPGTAVDMTWEKFSDDSWFSMTNPTSSWGLQADIVILAVIGDGAVGIDDAAALNGMRMSILGANPANANVDVVFDLTTAADVRLMVIDGKGARMTEERMGRTGQGRHQTTLDVSGWANGTYYVSLFADGKPITKKLTVAH